MPFRELLGRFATLTIVRFAPPGAILADPARHEGPDPPTILLPRGETPDDAIVGDTMDVFIHLDSDDRPIATLRTPKIVLGEVAFLTVTDVTAIGAFVDWGLVKELLVPFSRQTQDMRVGERYPIGLYLDSSDRLAGTMRVSEMLHDVGDFKRDEWVEGEAWRKTAGLGIFVIVEKAFVGLLPESEPHSLGRGDAARFRVANVLPDGKIELSLRAHAHEEMEKDATRLLEVLGRPGAPALGDHSSPEQIRTVVGLSKKAFKRAAGRLLRERKVNLDEAGHLRVASAAPRPPGRR
jgi:hypothetical protein